MRLRNWLLTSSSVAMVVLAPASLAQAQDAALTSAYQNLVQAQASGDANAANAAQAAFAEQCIASGFSALDACVGAATGGGAPAEPAAEEPAPEPVQEAAPEPVVEEPAPEPVQEPAPEPVAEEPAPEPVQEAAPEPVAEEPAPEPVQEAAPEPVAEEPAPEVVEEVVPEPVQEALPEPIAEEPTPEVVEEVVPQPVQEAAPEPVAEEPAPEVVEEVAPEPQVRQNAAPDAGTVQEAAPEPVNEQPAPEVVQEPAADQPATIQEPSAETPVTDTPVTQEPATEQPASDGPADFAAGLDAQVQAYNSAAASIGTGDNDDAARASMSAASEEIARLCGIAGYTDPAQCLADYGLSLNEAPTGDAAAGEPVTSTTDPAAIQQELANDPMLIDQPTEDVTNLREGVAQEEVAPLLDSAKDQVTRIESGTPAGESAPAQAAAQEPAGPAPTSDADAQSQVAIAPEQITSVTAEQGETIEASPELQVPQNVTIINQVTNNNTTVNNTSVTNTTTTNNTTTNNAAPGQTAGLQPANGNAVSFDVNFVFEVNNETYINNNARERERIRRNDEDEITFERLPRGRVRETVERPDGTQVVTVRARNGDIIRRSRITPDGREYVLAYFNDDYEEDLVEYRDPGDDLPPLRLSISAREYVLDSEFADEDDVEVFFSQPPVEEVRRLYSIDEVKRSARIRDSVRRLEVGGLTFDSGKATISRDQVATLSKVAAAMQDLLDRNPAETFLIEGHTDAVGSEYSNLALSDLRASTVARILTDFYDIPPENLAAQGYGERYLKVRTELDERANRRVTIRRITPLVTPLVASN